MSSLPVGVSARRALLTDEEALWGLQVHREAWLVQQGMPSIANGFSEAQQRGFLREHLAKSEVWVFEEAGAIVGQIRLHADDTLFWAGREDASAAYIHGLVVNQHGRGLGLAVLRWAESQWQARGKRANRLDCAAANAKLCDYYRQAGYQEMGRTRLKSGWEAMLFEKPL